MRLEKERENIRNKIYEPVDNEIHFQPENLEELEELLLLHEDEPSFVCSLGNEMSDNEELRDMYYLLRVS